MIALFVAAVPTASRSPSWGAWIEIKIVAVLSAPDEVAPPRGERGLKSEKEGEGNEYK